MTWKIWFLEKCFKKCFLTTKISWLEYCLHVVPWLSARGWLCSSTVFRKWRLDGSVHCRVVLFSRNAKVTWGDAAQEEFTRRCFQSLQSQSRGKTEHTCNITLVTWHLKEMQCYVCDWEVCVCVRTHACPCLQACTWRSLCGAFFVRVFELILWLKACLRSLCAFCVCLKFEISPHKAPKAKGGNRGRLPWTLP